MSATTLPRPSRPSIAPPTGPLPSLPVAKSRVSNIGPASRTSSASLLPSPTVAARAVSSSALPLRPSSKGHTNSASNVPTLTTTESPAGPLPAGKSLRKTVSIGAFPQPPKHVGRSAGSHPPSPLSASLMPNGDTMDQRLSAATRISATPSRQSSMKRPTPRVSTGGRGLLSKSPLTPPSFLNGSGESVAVVNTSHLSLPSPPQSRNSSAQGSYATSATTFEDIGDDEPRGRPDSKFGPDGGAGPKDGKGNVLVSVRVRPTGGQDKQQEQEWEINNKQALISYNGKEGGEYNYDNVFDTQDNNARVYDAAAKRLVRRVMEGYHGTVFAYGMTGTGKTFSMQGTATNPGVIPLAITDIFSYIRETPHREFLLRVSYLEIYNEKIHDLLVGPVAATNGQPGAQEEIKLREDSKRGVYATPLKEEIVQSPTQLLRVIARGDNARRVAGTQFNARSSRSHAVVQIVVESRERVPGGAAGSLKESKRSAIAPGGVRVSTLSLIDLAGSEKAAENKERRTEGSHINKSLLTLGTVIARLSSDKEKAGSEKDKASKEKHLPYRDSKLTRLLQPALSGGSLVSILCTIQIGSSGSVAAGHSHTGETLNTLKFASRAKNNIVSHAKKADESLGSGGDAGSRALLDRYRLEIQDLRKQLEEQNKGKESGDAKEVKEEEEKNEEEEKIRQLEDQQRHEEQMLEMQLARTALKERIEHLNRLILSSKSLGVNANRSFSSMSFQRGSTISNGDASFRPISARSSASHATLEVPAQNGTHAPFPSLPNEGSEEDDSVGENGDGLATQATQIHALQADLMDKNRYISTLEKRLLQARRSSHSRVSMSLSKTMSGSSEDGGLIAVVAEKDAEIINLRAQLEDKEKMIAALTSAGKKRDNANEVGSDGSPGSRRTSHQSQQRSEGSNSSIPKVKGTAANNTQNLVHTPRSERDLADVTRMLDEMISGRIDSANGTRKSLRPVTEGRRRDETTRNSGM
ncbi:kinesin-domain-containing protein [Amniculicola lignicola CBS 123094]|uniref:Kinesin-like protein n=1 Tax=Amniculicola lignicola CBS 123094 TaxID=1392246 RepID=A0A6A5W2I7_9PLEO|nr:kinesin-domain-containing protein [Amniculicola lignicola CBS 123094]